MIKKNGIFGQQPENPNETSSGSLKAGLIGSAAFASGFIPYKEGRLFDKYVSIARTIETASPSAILRTFRVSETLSTLESYNSLNVPSEILGSKNKYSQYLKTVFGEGIESLTLEHQAFGFGVLKDQTGKEIGEGIQILASTQKGSGVADYYARLYGIDLDLEGIAGANRTESLNDILLRAEYKRINPAMPYSEWFGTLSPAEKQKRIILAIKYKDQVTVAGKQIQLSIAQQKALARTEVLANLARAEAAVSAGRLNTLLRAPLEMPLIGDLIKKIPFVKSLPVEPGSATKLFKGYIGKGIAIAGAFKGLEYIDYLKSSGQDVKASVYSTFGGAALGGFLAKRVGERFSSKGVIAGAALGLAASLMPRFNDGIFYGAASIYSDLQIARAQASETLGVTESLQEHNRIAPGLSSFKTALGFAGVGMMTAGIMDYGVFLGKGTTAAVRAKDLSTTWSMFDELRSTRKAKLAETIWESGIGQKVAKTTIGKQLTKLKHPMAFGALGGLAIWAGLNAVTGIIGGNPVAAIPGAGWLGTEETPEELSSIYSGEKEVGVRKGRWWEMGRSSDYEGGRIEYYRQHMIARLKNRSFQKGLWDSEEERWSHDPVLNPLKALFGSDEWKYYYEQKYQYERPAPVTGTYGEGIPFIGPLVAATFGKIIKPRKEIRSSEWNFGNGQYAEEPSNKKEDQVAYELGGLGPGAPVSSDEGTQVFNRLNYRRREAIGLPGFIESVFQKNITGREETFQNLTTMESMGRETSGEYWLWKHLNLGGAAGFSEPIRRFLPRTPSYLDEYNPLINNLPSWMPEDYFLDFRHGNPITKISEGELRLPGPGYASRFPELKGVDPEDYPLIHRLKILSDVAEYSPEYRKTLSIARNTNLSDRDQMMLDEIERQVSERKDSKRKFSPYNFEEDQLSQEKVTISKVLSPREVLTEEYKSIPITLQGIGAISDQEAALEFARDKLEGKQVFLSTASIEGRSFTGTGRMKGVISLGETDFGQILADKGLAAPSELDNEFSQMRFSANERLAGRIAETALHNISTPIESLTPFSPESKFIRTRSPIEEYKLTQAYGTGNAFWDRPYENFIRPTIDTSLNKIGIDSIPSHIQERRDIMEYFDMLKWAKEEKIRREALRNNDIEAATEAQIAKESTLFGADIYGMPPIHTLPRQERDFFESFVNAQSPEDRAEILGLIPENEQRLYVGQWLRQEEQASRIKLEAGVGTEKDERIVQTMSGLRKAEGFDYSGGLVNQWKRETNEEIPYDEWIRLKKAEEYFNTHSLPGADWLGWCIPPDQYLLSNNKLLEASKIEPKEKVTTLQGEKEVNQKFNRLTKEEMITIKVHHNTLHSMSATRDHIVLAIKGKRCKYNLRPESICSERFKCWKCNFCGTKHYESYKPEWIPMKEIDTNTFMPIPLLKHADKNPIFDLGVLNCFPDNILILDNIIRPKNGRTKPMNRRIEMDESLAWLIGYYLAEGNVWAVGNRMRGVQFTSHIKEVPILELAQKIIKEKFGLDSIIRFKKASNSAYLVVASGIFGWVINSWVGRYCDKKFAPIWLEKITLQSQNALLDGLNTGDSTKDRKSRLVLANRNLCEMAKRIYEASGVPVSLHGPKRTNGKNQYSVEPLRSSLSVLIGENFIAYRVQDIKEVLYEGNVLDFDIKEEHMYCSPIGIYHNSPSIDLDDVKMKFVQSKGLDYHDYDLWENRARMLARKPYINDTLVEEMTSGPNNTLWGLDRLLGARESNIMNSRISANIDNAYRFEIKDGRENMIEKAYKEMGA